MDKFILPHLDDLEPKGEDAGEQSKLERKGENVFDPSDPGDQSVNTAESAVSNLKKLSFAIQKAESHQRFLDDLAPTARSLKALVDSASNLERLWLGEGNQQIFKNLTPILENQAIKSMLGLNAKISATSEHLTPKALGVTTGLAKQIELLGQSLPPAEERMGVPRPLLGRTKQPDPLRPLTKASARVWRNIINAADAGEAACLLLDNIPPQNASTERLPKEALALAERIKCDYRADVMDGDTPKYSMDALRRIASDLGFSSALIFSGEQLGETKQRQKAASIPETLPVPTNKGTARTRKKRQSTEFKEHLAEIWAQWPKGQPKPDPITLVRKAEKERYCDDFDESDKGNEIRFGNGNDLSLKTVRNWLSLPPFTTK